MTVQQLNHHRLRYVTFFAWSLANWITFNPLINRNSDDRTLSFIAKLLFGIMLCAIILLAEKFAIQWIAGKFHEKSYAGKGSSFGYVLSALNIKCRAYRRAKVRHSRSDGLVPQLTRHSRPF